MKKHCISLLTDMSREKIFDRLKEFAEITDPKFVATARTKSIIDRKMAQRNLDASRQKFTETRQAYEEANARLAEQQNLVDQLQSQLNESRQNLLSWSETLRTMDLSGANACRDRKDHDGNPMKTYYIGNREHVVNDCDSPIDVQVKPYRQYMQEKNEEYDKIPGLDDEPADDAEDSFADAIVSSDFSRF